MALSSTASETNASRETFSDAQGSTPGQGGTPSTPSSAKADGGVTRRAVAISLLLAVVFGYIVPIIDLKMSNTFLGAAHLPPGAIAALLVLLLVVNPLLRLVSERLVLSRNESLVVYISCLFSCLVPGHGAENFFIANVIGPFYYATSENGWLKFLQGLPHWISPALGSNGLVSETGKQAIADWYNGNGGHVPWGLWLVPLLAWSSLVFASYTMLGCLSVMLRAQWAQKEALAFPLLRLPLELSENDEAPHRAVGPFFRNSLMWVGFGIAAFIQLCNGLNLYFPDFPQVPLEIKGAFFTEAPLNQIGWLPMKVLPIVIGVTYLLTSEVSFSMWFFYLFMKAQAVFAYTIGFPTDVMPAGVGAAMGAKTYASYQMVGAYLMFVAMIFWTARGHLSHVVARAFGRARAGETERGEALSYPVAFWGFVLSFLFLVGWSLAAGINVLVALALWGGYLVLAVALTRLVVEAGVLFVQGAWTPLGTLAQLFPSGTSTLIPTSSIAPASLLSFSMMYDMRGFLMPSFMQSFKLAYDRKINSRPLLGLIVAVTLVTFAMSVWMNIRLGYQTGGLSLNGWFQAGPKGVATGAQQLLGTVQGATWGNWVWMIAGALLTYLMILARSRFLWFPLHPLGYLTAITYPMNTLWFSILVGWLCKVLITRFGGSDTYRKTVPLFLGLALGDVSMMLFWLVIDGWQGKIYHQLMPG